LLFVFVGTKGKYFVLKIYLEALTSISY
jgi:hypothetical protein